MPREAFYRMYYKFEYEKFVIDLSNTKLEENKRSLEMGLSMLEQDQVKVFVDSVYSWCNVSQALDRVALQHSQGKVVVSVEEF